jgi:cell division septum initiation protein DivIVA|tara:strand:- start:976 stop:1209 length:234 start_codon:yes stop_codon:yes gene_type:complete
MTADNMAITPPEPTKREVLEDVDEHSKKYLNAKEDLKGALEEIERYKNEMKLASAHLWYHYSIEEDEIKRVDWDECN